MIGLADYVGQGYSGWGSMTLSADEAVGLAKALDVNYDSISGATGSNRTLSLEHMLKYATWSKPEEFALWDKMPKTPAYDSVEVWDEATNHGTMAGGFTLSMEVPPEQDGAYTRRSQNVKFMTTYGAVTDPMQSILPAHGNVLELKVRERMLWLLQRINHFCYVGDSSLKFSGEGEEFNGLDAQMDSTAGYDLRGDVLTRGKVDDIVTALVDDHAMPTDLFLSNKALADYNQSLAPKERIAVPMDQAGIVGSAANGQLVCTGKPIRFTMDKFLRGTLYRSPSPSATATSTQAPNAPFSVTAAKNVGVTTADFTKGDTSTGTTYYDYAITLGNRFGESAPILQPTAASLSLAERAAGNSIDVVVTLPTNIGPWAPDWIGVYRTAPRTSSTVPSGVSSYSLIRRVRCTTQTGGATQTISDLNLYLAFTESAYILQFDPEVLEFAQLLPMMYKELAAVSFARRFGIALFGTPKLYGRKRIRRIFNIGAMTV
jgi:hypothetical protein